MNTSAQLHQLIEKLLMIEIIEFPSNPHLAGKLTGDQSH